MTHRDKRASRLAVLLSKKNRMGKQSQRAKPPRDGDDAARATSTRAEDAFELLADTVAAAVDAVELAAHAGGLFFGLGLVAAHAAARRGLWAAACAWCVCNWTFSGRRPARAAAAAALAAALSVAESDTIVLASDAETEVVWLLRHALAPAVVGCVAGVVFDIVLELVIVILRSGTIFP